jgi:predicted dehydrogenase
VDRLRIGIVGLHFGHYIVEGQIAQGPGAPFFELAAVCDLDRARADEVAGKQGVSALYDLDALIARKDIPVIGLFTGPNGRADLIRKIIRAGKDVMTTKPFERDPEAALRILREARELGRVVHLNSPGPLPTDDLRKIQEWRAKYSLGRPIAAHAGNWASYREKPDGSWYDDPERCPCAPLFRIGIYPLNDILGILGEPDAVQVFQTRVFTGRPTADNVEMTIRFREGALAQIFASFCIADGAYWRNALTIHFENGTVYRNVGPGLEQPETVHLEVVAHAESRGRLTESVQLPAGRCSGSYPWEYFAQSVRGGRRLAEEVAPEQVAASVRVIRAMAKAAQSGKTEAV